MPDTNLIDPFWGWMMLPWTIAAFILAGVIFDPRRTHRIGPPYVTKVSTVLGMALMVLGALASSTPLLVLPAPLLVIGLVVWLLAIRRDEAGGPEGRPAA